MNEPEVIEEVAPDDIQKDLHQCNRSCRQHPRLVRIGKQWIAMCICSRIAHEDMLMALLHWNGFNLIKKITPSAKLAALRELNRRIAEKLQ